MTEITGNVNEKEPGDRFPWLKNIGEVPATLEYFEGSLYDAVEKAGQAAPSTEALVFMGRRTSYAGFLSAIKKAAASLHMYGVTPGDRVTVAMPNCPQAVEIFYAINYLGAVASMVHPLSGENELKEYIELAESKIVITLDQFADKMSKAAADTCCEKVILASVRDELPLPLKIAYDIKTAKKKPVVPKDERITTWKDFIGKAKEYKEPFEDIRFKTGKDDTAVILYSGGTTGHTKGILLSNMNFNALGAQVLATNPMFRPEDRMLAAMPLFHGFGLGVCVHTMLMSGGTCVLVPRFTPKTYGRMISKYKCAFIAGVPSLYEALLRIDDMDRAKLGFLKGVFSGGDSLTPELKKKIDRFLKEHGATVTVREGYGTTETVTACCLTPAHMAKEGSIGIPFPDTYIKIVRPGTEEELPYGEEGEILLAGPTVMKGYMNDPEETAKTLRKHSDGKTWVYTGDLGTMDDDGFIYFKGRIKRIIISSGYNIYPARLENVLDAYPKVHMSCVIGIPDPVKIKKVKAFIMLKPGVEKSDETKEEIMEHCRKNIAKYALPAEIEFRDELPKTLVGKVAYRILEEEEQKRREKDT